MAYNRKEHLCRGKRCLGLKNNAHRVEEDYNKNNNELNSYWIGNRKYDNIMCMERGLFSGHKKIEKCNAPSLVISLVCCVS